jgi:alanine-alpha-ketoisovalerate/valine-pyruvate aminotransferase
MLFSPFLLEAFENAQFLCESYYLKSPRLEVRIINGSEDFFFYHFNLFIIYLAIHPNEPIAIPYVASHLYHVMFELFKVKSNT